MEARAEEAVVHHALAAAEALTFVGGVVEAEEEEGAGRRQMCDQYVRRMAPNLQNDSNRWP